MAMGAILGIAAYGRTQEKVAGISMAEAIQVAKPVPTVTVPPKVS
jgi:hypothetical protein